jgi:predicted nucleotidyltransferase
MKYGITEKTIRKINTVLAHYPQVEQATLYGSRATGNYKNGSDIDLALYGESLTFSTLSHITEELDDLLLTYTITLSIFADISDPDVVDHIRRIGAVFMFTRCFGYDLLKRIEIVKKNQPLKNPWNKSLHPTCIVSILRMAFGQPSLFTGGFIAEKDKTKQGQKKVSETHGEKSPTGSRQKQATVEWMPNQ